MPERVLVSETDAGRPDQHLGCGTSERRGADPVVPLEELYGEHPRVTISASGHMKAAGEKPDS